MREDELVDPNPPSIIKLYLCLLFGVVVTFSTIFLMLNDNYLIATKFVCYMFFGLLFAHSFPFAYLVHFYWKIPKGTPDRKRLELFVWIMFFAGFLGTLAVLILDHLNRI